MIPVEFAQNNIFCEKPVFKGAEMAKDGKRWHKDGGGDGAAPSFCHRRRHLLPSFAISAPLKTGFSQKILFCANSTGITEYLRKLSFCPTPSL